ncbi:hypothetical protein FDECE_13253 [Fusarium decemcellulare]|nr:hypothetical protein FDECE_13253 [Fusarium decemcellulare]
MNNSYDLSRSWPVILSDGMAMYVSDLVRVAAGPVGCPDHTLSRPPFPRCFFYASVEARVLQLIHVRPLPHGKLIIANQSWRLSAAAVLPCDGHLLCTVYYDVARAHRETEWHRQLGVGSVLHTVAEVPNALTHRATDERHQIPGPIDALVHAVRLRIGGKILNSIISRTKAVHAIIKTAGNTIPESSAYRSLNTTNIESMSAAAIGVQAKPPAVRELAYEDEGQRAPHGHYHQHQGHGMDRHRQQLQREVSRRSNGE